MIEGQAKCVWEVLAASWQGAAGPQLAPSAVQFAHHAKTRPQPELCKYIQEAKNRQLPDIDNSWVKRIS